MILSREDQNAKIEILEEKIKVNETKISEIEEIEKENEKTCLFL